MLAANALDLTTPKACPLHFAFHDMRGEWRSEDSLPRKSV